MDLIERIQYQDNFLKEENIDNNISILWGRALPILMHRKYLYDRFTRKYDKSDVVVERYLERKTIQTNFKLSLIILPNITTMVAFSMIV